jgi:hypothetical protein
MSYGPNTALVLEVLDFAERGPLLRPSKPIDGERFFVVDDFEEACAYAYERPISDAEDAPDWTTLREQAASAILGASDALMRDALDGLLNQFHPAVSQRVPRQYAETVDDVLGDLINVASSRAVFSAGDRLFDKVWEAYRAGGWPCGWIGDYPEGRLVVYQPPL